jgi:hypothetical protein
MVVPNLLMGVFELFSVYTHQSLFRCKKNARKLKLGCQEGLRSKKEAPEEIRGLKIIETQAYACACYCSTSSPRLNESRLNGFWTP